MPTPEAGKSQAGFSLIELIIAMSITLVVMSIAVTFLAGSLGVRARESARTAALADAQHALNIMSREVANAGFGLTSNGIVAADSGANSIRVRANLNAYQRLALAAHNVSEQDEDVMFSLQANADGSFALIRSDIGMVEARVLANPINSLTLRYFNAAGTELAANAGNNAARVKITLAIILPAVGAPGSAGYQPQSTVQLASDVALRNSNLYTY